VVRLTAWAEQCVTFVHKDGAGRLTPLERTILATDGRIVLHARIPPEVAIAALENSERVRQARRKGDDRCSGGG
jgi:hypothetical protein